MEEVIKVTDTHKPDNSDYFIAKYSEVNYRLLVGEGTSKQRLLENRIMIELCLSMGLPDVFKSDVDKLKNLLHKVPETRIDEKNIFYTSIYNTISKMQNRTASKVIGLLYDLYCSVKAYRDEVKN